MTGGRLNLSRLRLCALSMKGLASDAFLVMHGPQTPSSDEMTGGDSPQTSHLAFLFRMQTVKS
jgi:hypothetical protein